MLTTGLLTQEEQPPRDRLSARLAYTCSRFIFLDDLFKVSGGNRVLDAEAGNTIPGFQEYWLNAGLRYEHPKGFWIAPAIQWSITGAFVDFENLTKPPRIFWST